MENYTAEDFSKLRFAAKNGLYTACRSLSGFWRTESGTVLSDYDMVRGGWSPVQECPHSEAKRLLATRRNEEKR